MRENYTVGNFRKNIKAALDSAITEPVYVQRGRDMFPIILVATDIPHPAIEAGKAVEGFAIVAAAPVAGRHKPDILDEIKARENLREDIEYSQDVDTNREIIKTAKSDLDALWDECNALWCMY